MPRSGTRLSRGRAEYSVAAATKTASAARPAGASSPTTTGAAHSGSAASRSASGTARREPTGFLRGWSRSTRPSKAGLSAEA